MSFQLRCWTSIFWNRRYLAIIAAGLWRPGLLEIWKKRVCIITLCRTTSPIPPKKERCEASIFKRVTLPRQSWCAAGRGAVLDVAVDLRKGSPTYKKWVAVELSAENKRQLLIPRGFGHGFVTLTDDVEFLYKEDNLYNPSTDRNILWNDPELGIDWRVENPILSEKDQRAPLLHDSDVDFVYKEK